MSTRQETIDFLVDQMSADENVLSRKMFGEYALYYDTKVIALVCDDQLFIKPTDKGRDFLVECDEHPPYPGAKLYFRVPEDKWDDAEWMSELVKITASELPYPKPKKAKRS